ncbi:hypothetical protein HK096_003336, partial [Nowakowskiella sp. JEL0078]
MEKKAKRASSSKLSELRKKQRANVIAKETEVEKVSNTLFPSIFQNNADSTASISPVTSSHSMPKPRNSNPFSRSLSSPSSISTSEKSFSPFAALLGIIPTTLPHKKNSDQSGTIVPENFEPSLAEISEILLTETKLNETQCEMKNSVPVKTNKSSSRLFSVLSESGKGNSSNSINHELIEMIKENKITADIEGSLKHIIKPLTSSLDVNASMSVKNISIGLTLKTKITFSSHNNFDWCDVRSKTSADSSIVISRLNWPEDRWKESHDPEISQTVIERRNFWRALHMWVYPARPTPKSHQTAVAKFLVTPPTELTQILELEYWRQSKKDWKVAFQSLYSAMKNEECPYFYYSSTETSVLFTSEGSNRNNECEAIMSHSTKGLRKILKDEDVQFISIVISRRTRNSNITSSKSTFYADPEDSMPLRFSGKRNVHALFDWLLNWTDGEFLQQQSALSEPVLIAPSCFLGASLKCAEVKQSILSSSDSKKIFKLEVSITTGLLPSTVKKIIEMVKNKDRDEEQLKISFVVDEATSGFKS